MEYAIDPILAQDHAKKTREKEMVSHMFRLRINDLLHIGADDIFYVINTTRDIVLKGLSSMIKNRENENELDAITDKYMHNEKDMIRNRLSNDIKTRIDKDDLEKLIELSMESVHETVLDVFEFMHKNSAPISN